VVNESVSGDYGKKAFKPMHLQIINKTTQNNLIILKKVLVSAMCWCAAFLAQWIN
jgi:hypothetical protein